MISCGEEAEAMVRGDSATGRGRGSGNTRPPEAGAVAGTPLRLPCWDLRFSITSESEE